MMPGAALRARQVRVINASPLALTSAYNNMDLVLGLKLKGHASVFLSIRKYKLLDCHCECNEAIPYLLEIVLLSQRQNRSVRVPFSAVVYSLESN